MVRIHSTAPSLFTRGPANAGPFSFRAAAICYPLYLVLLSFRVAQVQWETSGVPTILIIETIAYVISWVAFPLLTFDAAVVVTLGASALGMAPLTNRSLRSGGVAAPEWLPTMRNGPRLGSWSRPRICSWASERSCWSEPSLRASYACARVQRSRSLPSVTRPDKRGNSQ